MESRSEVRKEKIHGELEQSKEEKDTWRAGMEYGRKRRHREHEWSKEGRGDTQSTSGVRKEKIHGELEWSNKEKETWRAGVK
jgi:hypothetical protein